MFYIIIIVSYLTLFLLISSVNTNKKNKSKENKYIFNEFQKLHYFKRIIIYKINPTAGLANTLRGMASTLFLSYIFGSFFYLKGWNSIVYYFNYPKRMIYAIHKNSSLIYTRYNNSLLKELKKESVIVFITDIHGYNNILLDKYKKNKRVVILKKVYNIKCINKSIINSIIYNEFFSPSIYIKKYLDEFKFYSKGQKVLGIHLRSEKYKINYTDKNTIINVLKKYFMLANNLILIYNITKVFAISDNAIISTELKQQYINDLIDIKFDGSIIHSRYALYKNTINNNAIRIVTEFILLSHCDAIIGTTGSSYSYESCNRLMKRCFFP